MEKLELKMLQYHIVRADAILNKTFDKPKDGTPININSMFNRRIEKKNENEAIVALSIKIDENKHPFGVFVEIEGLFQLNNWEQESDSKTLMIENSTAILFPYLRQAVTTLTSLLGVSPFVLPVMNTYNLFNSKE